MRDGGASQDPNVLRQQVDRARRDIERLSQEDVIIDATKRLILRSPNGTFWNVTVDNDGDLATTSMGNSL